MSILWRYRFIIPAFLLLISCDAQIYNEAQTGKLVYARGNHWAVGHLMGKKSLDDQLNSDEPESKNQGYSIRAEPGRDAPTSRLLRELVTALTGPGRERRQQMAQRDRLWDERLARGSEISQVADVLVLALNTRDLDAS